MSQIPQVESGNKPSQTPLLKPGLAAALASLEVHLDEELGRYRRAKAGHQSHIQPPLRSSASYKSLDLIDISATGGRTQPQTADVKTPPPPPGFVPPASPSVPGEQKPTTQELNIPTPPKTPDSAQTEPISPTLGQRSKSEELNTPIISTTAAYSAPTEPTPDRNSGSIVHTRVNQPTAGGRLDSSASRMQPDDYLESSEALLQSLADEQPHSDRQAKHSDSLLSPLGIGSMLLLLLASATLGYVVMNPLSLRQLGVDRLFASNSTNNAANPSGTVANSAADPQILTPVPKSPNLAAREFVDLNLDNLITLKPKPTPTPSASPSPTNPATTTTVQPQLTPPRSVQSVQVQPLVPLSPPQLPTPPVSSQPAAPRTTTSQQPAATENNQEQELKPSADGYYHIVADNSNAQTLEEVRKVVADAYLSPRQTLIYLAAVKSPEEAKQRLQDLQAKGIKARISQQ